MGTSSADPQSNAGAGSPPVFGDGSGLSEGVSSFEKSNCIASVVTAPIVGTSAADSQSKTTNGDIPASGDGPNLSEKGVSCNVKSTPIAPLGVKPMAGDEGQSFSVLSQGCKWSSVAGGTLSPSDHFKPVLEVVHGILEVVVPDEFVVKDKPLWGCYLLGHFIGDAPHVGTVHATVNRLWNLPEKS